MEKADGGVYGCIKDWAGRTVVEWMDRGEDRLVARLCDERRRAEGVKDTSETERDESVESLMPSPETWSCSAEGRERSMRPWSWSSSRRDMLRR